MSPGACGGFVSLTLVEVRPGLVVASSLQLTRPLFRVMKFSVRCRPPRCTTAVVVALPWANDSMTESVL